MNISFKKLTSWASVSVFLLIIIAFFCLNFNFPLHSDDFRYHYIWPTVERTQGLYDVVLSQKAHYMTWAGRIFAISSVQFSLLFDKIVFDIVNTLMYALAAVAVCSVCKSMNFRSAAIVAAVMLAEPGIRYLWISSACVYLWSTAIVAGYLALVLSPSHRCKWLSCFLALFAGNCQETMGLALCVSLFFYYLMNRPQIKNPALWVSSALLVAGTASNLFSPGNFARMGGVNVASELSALQGITYEMVNTVALFMRALRHGLLIPGLIVLGAVAVHAGYYYRYRHIHPLGLSFLIGACSSVIIPLGARCFYGAAMHGCTLFCCLSVAVILLPALSRCRAPYYWGILMPASALFVHSCVKITQRTEGMKELASYVEKQVKSGCYNVVIPRRLACYRGFAYHNNYRSNIYETEVLGLHPYSAFVREDEISVLQNKESRNGMKEGEIRLVPEETVMMRLAKEPILVTGVYLPEFAELSVFPLRKFIHAYPMLKPVRFKPALFAEDGNIYLFFPLQRNAAELKVDYADGSTVEYRVELRPEGTPSLQQL